MKIEIGVSVGAAVGGLEGGFAGLGRIGSAPALGGISFVPRIVSEGPAKAADFAGFKKIVPVEAKGPKLGEQVMPTKALSPIGELRFNRPKNPLGFVEPVKPQEALISDIETFLSKARKSSRLNGQIKPVVAEARVVRPFVRGIVPQAESTIQPAVILGRRQELKPIAAVSPALDLSTQAQTQAESKPTNKLKETTLAQPVLEEQQEELEEIEQKLVKQIKQVKQAEDQTEEVEVRVKRHVVDKLVLKTVLHEVRQAIAKAKELAEEKGLGRKILGPLIAKLLPGEHEGNIGGAVKPYGSDGTVEIRRETIAAVKEFSSEKEVYKKVFEHRPVTIAEEGEASVSHEVEETYRGKIVKPKKEKIVEIFTTRIVKKKALDKPGAKIQTVMAGSTEASKELTIKQLNSQLAAVFQQAA